jgi:membrane-associated protease RseP (regulator of RpoE activity)
MVTNVPENSFGEDIEMEKGDIILAINRHQIGSADDMRKITASLKSGDAVAVLIVRPAPERLAQAGARGGTGKRGSVAPAAQAIPDDAAEPMYLSGRLP